MALKHDANGNLTSDGATGYGYDVENRLTSAWGARTASLRYDPLGRLYEVSSGRGTTRFLWSVDELAVEYSPAGTVVRRYAHGGAGGVDDPRIWFEFADLTSPRYLHTDHQGSVIAMGLVNRYGE